jgi:hypothetical protein
MLYLENKNFNEAGNNFARCLQIQQAIKGQESIECSLTYSNIGKVYLEQNNLQLAL